MSIERDEDLLRRTLSEKSREADATLTFDDVRRDAAATRRRSAWRTSLLAAAVVAVVVGAPAAFLLRPGDGGPGPAPSHSPTGPASTAPTATTADLAAIPRGKDPRVAYLHDGVVHLPDGSTTRLPAAATDVVGFTPYHGGWLVRDSVGGLVLYDNTGAVVQRWQGEDVALALEADQMRTAFGTPGRIHVGISTGMGGGEISFPSGSARLVGFVKDQVGNDDVVTSGGGQVQYIHGVRNTIPGLSAATATASGSDLVGGVAPDGTSGRVVTIDGRVQWTLPWQPRAFSPDGRYVVAVLESTDSEPTDVGILDARTGSVLARLSLADRGLRESTPLVWEELNGSALIGVIGDGKQAVLRLAPAGDVTRATDVVAAPDASPWVFGTTP